MITDQIRAEFEKWWGENEEYFDDVVTSTARGIFQAGYTARQAENKEALELLDDLRQTIYLRPFQDEIENKIKAIKKALGGI